MNTTEFRSIKAEFRKTLKRVLLESEPGRMDEAGLPAYTHANPLIHWLFWRRLKSVLDYIEGDAPYQNILDFGCGAGVLIPFLCHLSRRVTAVDVDLLPFERVRRQRPFPAHVEVHQIQPETLGGLPEASVDLIIATDVLEHVDDLSGTLAVLRSRLVPDGQIIVSGPTENLFYRIGRRLAGPEFSGHYHKRGIGEIRTMMSKEMHIDPIATLFGPMPLFHVFAAREVEAPRSGGG